MAGLFDAYSAIIDRLNSQTTGFTFIGSPSQAISINDVVDQLPGCYVQPGNGQPTEKGNTTILRHEQQTWITLLTVEYFDNGVNYPEIELGQLALQVINSLNFLQITTPIKGVLEYQDRSAIEYEEGFVLLRLRFNFRAIFNQ